MHRYELFALPVILLFTALQSACAQDATEPVPPKGAEPMTAERLGELVLRIDSEAQQNGPAWQFVVDGFETILVYDVDADRMRVMTPINDADALPAEELVRLMQANFDSALDARYAIANDILWGVFIHPLSSLTDSEFLLGVGQTVNVAATFGKSYSSGMFIFGGGDSQELEQERQRLLEELEELSGPI